MFAAALVGAALLIGAAGPVAADDEAPKESIAEYVSPTGHVAGSAAEAIGSATQGAGAGRAVAAVALLGIVSPMPCPGTQTFAV
jgi:hypothetical protein